MLRHNAGQRRLRESCLFILFLALLAYGGVCQAQDTHALTHYTCNPHMGNATDIVYADNGTIFLIGEGGGLWAFQRDEAGFTPLAYYPVPSTHDRIARGPDGVLYLYGRWQQLTVLAYGSRRFEVIAQTDIATEKNDLAIGPDGTLFVASGHDGLIAYRREGGTFTPVAKVHDGGYARAVAIGENHLVYLASGNDPVLSVYDYDGNTFTCMDMTNEGAVLPNAIATGPDGSIFLADENGGVSAYAFTELGLTLTASVNDGGSAQDVAVSKDGHVYLANANDGLRTYEYDGSAFMPLGHWRCDASDARSVDVDEKNGIAILANGQDGLRAIYCNGSTNQCLAHCDDGDEAYGVATASDGTIFLANGRDGLRAYRPTETILTCTAWTNMDAANAVDARAVAVDWLDRVYLAHDGVLSVYDYTGDSFETIATCETAGDVNSFAVDPQGWVYLACGENGLQVLQFDGIDMRAVALVRDVNYAHDVALAENGSVYLASDAEGLRAYRWFDGDFQCAAHADIQDIHQNWVMSVAAGPGNTLFLLDGQIGLQAYRFSGDTFTRIASLDLPVGGYFGGGSTMTVARDGTVFFAYNTHPGVATDGLYACELEGENIRITAHVENPDYAADLAVSSDGIVYLADQRGGLLGYHYTSVAANPQLMTDRDEIDFGPVALGTVRLQYLVVSNVGSTPLRIREQRIDDENGSGFSMPYPLPAEIAAGESARLGILCQAWTDGEKNAQLIIAADDPENAAVSIPIHATVTGNLVAAPVPPTIKLEQNIPNPFNPSTTIRFAIPVQGPVKLDVYNLTGNRVAALFDGLLTAGWHDIHFDATSLASGIYLYRLETADGVRTRRMILMK